MAGLNLPIGGGLLAAAAAFSILTWSDRAEAAKAAGCDGGGFTIVLPDGGTVGPGATSIPAAALGQSFLVRGRYIEFTVVSASFGIRNYLFTGAANPEDITGNRRTVVWSEKTPDHKGLALSGPASVEFNGSDIVIQRASPALTMTLSAKDCATGGIFQMEPQRGDGDMTLFTHVLDPAVFYFDNPNFRAREGDILPFKDTTVTVRPRINIANDVSNKFVARDSPQVAERRDEPTCSNPIPTRTGGIDIVLHCGGVSRWDVASGGRVGFVTGEDAVEVAPGATDCVKNCQAQNRVRGQAVILGFPFPVPENVRLKPRAP
jgi:hypothetical protein